MTLPATPRAEQTRRGLAATLVAVCLAALFAIASPADATPTGGAPQDADRPPLIDPPVRDGEQVAHLEASLQDASGTETVTVVVEAASTTTARQAVEAVGGKVTTESVGLVAADVRKADLRRLAGAPGVRIVREPRPVVSDVISEGVAATGSQAWQTGTFTGAGTTVAIVDGGFDGYLAKLGTELPATVQTDFSRCSGTGGSVHGTAVAEIVHDMAPDATLRLVCIVHDAHFANALDALPAAVDVVNGSIGFTGVGRGDGTGGVSDAVARARDRGVLYVAAAGNYGGSHFHANAVGDTPGPSLGDLVNFTADEGVRFAVPSGGTAFVSVQWDGWPTTTQDFDAYIENDAGTIVDGSENDQATGAFPRPTEQLAVTNGSGVARNYFVLVNRFAGTATPRLDMTFDGDAFAIETPTASNVADPGSSPAAFTVGAHCVDTNAVESFSSQGPTIDGRIKPDISGPDGTSSSVYGANPAGPACGGFFGTSAASPHVAGAAAQVLQANPNLDVAELQKVLEDKAAPAGPAGQDNAYGKGLLRLGTAGSVPIPTARPFTPRAPIRLYDTRPGTPGASEVPSRSTPVGPGGKLKVKVADVAGVPSDATAVVLNVTAVAPTADGFVTIHPGGPVPVASNLNFKAGKTVAVHVTATVGTIAGYVDQIELVNAVGNTHLIVDLAGWYGPTNAADGQATDLLHTLPAPARALDTRPGTPGYAEGGGAGVVNPINSLGFINLPVAGAGGVPADATAVVLNVTAVQPTADTFLVASPTGSPQPNTSSLNASKNQIVANLVVVPVGTSGMVRFFNSAGKTHLVVDTIGWFKAGEGGAGYIALDPPTRDLDTRTGIGLRKTPLGSNGSHNLKVARYYGVPEDALAVMLGVVAVSPTAGGYLTIYPSTQPLPPSSNLNFAAGTTTPNAVLSGIGSTGAITFKNSAGTTTHVISDLFGYFIDPNDQP